ncbi:MAG: adenylate/guanylate cyclase domain-containing protein [Oscillospiraceae bacterium]|nr:adenylate/guanylate cyclase domain-containing protein [Oscillospiraceae bacterium]
MTALMVLLPSSVDSALSDTLLQPSGGTDGEIVVIGMDQRALDALGPMPWSRSVMAEAIGYLNADPASAPAAIGIDVLFVGESGNPEADEYLAEIAALEENVIVASAATIGNALVQTEDGFYMEDRAVLAWDMPYPALADAVKSGHINANVDADGVLRHCLLYVDVPDYGREYSFARAIYERFCAARGETVNPLPPVTGDGFWYLPFSAGPGGYYDGVSVLDLLEGTVDPDYFSGKIVLIGPYAAGMLDNYITSADHALEMYGVEIQANAIDAFRAGFYPREAARLPQMALVFFISLLALWLFRDRRLLITLPIWAALSAGWIGLCLLLYRRGWVLHALWVPLAVSLLLIGSVASNYIRAARDRHRVVNTFGRYVDPAIMRQLLEKGGEELELGGKTYEIAVLFVDIRGFTTMSESLSPATVVEIINMYLTLTTRCIMRYHGTLDKFVGDCTMAFWNAPLPQPDAVYMACRAAMDMVEGSKALGEELLRRFGRTVSFGVGVHTGPAVVGNIGAPQRMDYTAIGDTVNTAARLESNAPAGTVYISRAVADALGPRARTTSLGGAIRLKGKAEGFEVLKLDHLDESSISS